MAAFEDRQAEEIQRAFSAHRIRRLFLGKCGAILLGSPDTTQDAVVRVEKQPDNCRALIGALHELGLELSASEDEDIRRGEDFVQLKNGPFDINLTFAPDGIGRFQDAWSRRVEVEGLPACRLEAFREYLRRRR
jgi:hypothetical protein